MTTPGAGGAALGQHVLGFPLDKAIAYAELRKPFLINDLEKQKSVLMDRRQVYQVLKENETFKMDTKRRLESHTRREHKYRAEIDELRARDGE